MWFFRRRNNQSHKLRSTRGQTVHRVPLSLEVLEDRMLPSVTAPVSIDTTGMTMGNSGSYTTATSISANGQYEVFTSSATNLVNGVTVNSGTNVFLRNLSTGTTSLVDVNSAGTAAGNQGAVAPAISADGRYVAFISASTDLTNNDAHGGLQAYVRDMQAGQTYLVSLGRGGQAPNGAAPWLGSVGNAEISIAEDGNDHLRIAYLSNATNLTQGDSNGNNQQVFVTTLNLESGGIIQYGSLSTTLVSADNTGTNGANSDSANPLLSKDGSTLIFTSTASNLNVPGGYSDNDPRVHNLYLYSLTSQKLKLVSAEPTATTATGNAWSSIAYNYPEEYQQSLSGNGQYAVFSSSSDNLVASVPTTGNSNVYLRNLATGQTSLVSVSSDGTSGANATTGWQPVVTPDGRYVAFTSEASNLTGNTNWGQEELFVRDMQQGRTYLVSRGIDNNPANMAPTDPSIAETSNGQLVIAYRSNATNLTSNDTNSAYNQVFVTTFSLDGSGNILDNTLSTKLASADSTGNGGNNDSNDAILSKDGSTLAFESRATNLPNETPNNADGNDHWQIYTYNIASGTLTQVSPAPPSGDVTDANGLSSISDDGQYLAYVDFNHATNVAELLAWTAGTGKNTLIYTTQGATYPVLNSSAVISGDGSTIAFRAGNVYGRAVIYAASNWQSGSPTLTQITPSPSSSVWSSEDPSISANGQVIAYHLTPYNGPGQIYVYSKGTITEVSQATNGGDSNDAADTPEVSADGSTILFNSKASNLVGGMIDFVAGQDNIYGYNVSSKTVSLVSAQGPGLYTSNQDIFSATLSDNGRYLAFDSTANDLVGNLPSATTMVFAEDVQAGVLTVIDPGSPQVQPVISGDGSTVAFQSNAPNLIANQTISGTQMYSRNWLAANPTTTLVSINTAGTGGGNGDQGYDAENPSISYNGQVIAFQSTANNLVTNDPNAHNYMQVFIRNLATNTTTLASVNSSGTDGGNNESDTPTVSEDGDVTVFHSTATDLLAGVTVTATDNVYANVTAVPPMFSSASSTTFTVGGPGSFTVTAGSFPAPTLSESNSDTLPAGVTFNTSTGVLSGTPAAASSGTYLLHFTATNSDDSVIQTFTLTVNQAPAITSSNSATFTIGQTGGFSVTATGFPAPNLTEVGVLPSGVTFTDNGNGTATLGGIPAAGTQGTYQFTIAAHNGMGSDATQNFILTINPAPLPPPPPAPPSPPPAVQARPAAVNTIGAFDPTTATWYLRDSNSPGATDVPAFAYGAPGWIPLVGDWNGSGTTTIGVVDPSTMTWYLRDTNTPGGPDIAPFKFGAPGSIPVVGDWNGDGTTTIGVVDPRTMTWYLRNENSPGAPDFTPFQFGAPGWTPVVGDWDGNGTTTIGAIDPRSMTWYLKNGNAPGAPDVTPFQYGTPGWKPVVGDWDANGTTTIGVVDPTTETWYLRNENSAGGPDISRFAFGAPGWSPLAGTWQHGLTATLWSVNPVNSTWIARPSDVPGISAPAPVAYGPPGSIPIVGDWNGDGTATLGAFDPKTATWYLRNSDTAGAPDITPFQYGAPDWIPVVGDWNGTGHTGIGVYDPTTGTWYLRNEDSAGAPDAGILRYGATGWLPVVGDWDNNGTATIGVVDPSTETWYLRNSNTPGTPDVAPFQYGAPGYLPVAGDWDGHGTGIGAIDPELAAWYLRSNVGPGVPDLGVIAFGEPGWWPAVASRKSS